MITSPGRHTISLVSAPKMDAPGLVAAVCCCGNYRSGSTSEHNARAAGVQHVAAATVNDVNDVITAGLAWLFDTVQPDGAAVSPLLATVGSGDRVFGFHGGDNASVTMTATLNDLGPVAPLTAADVNELRNNLTNRGHTVTVKPGTGKRHFRVDLILDRPCHPSLAAAVALWLSKPTLQAFQRVIPPTFPKG